MTYRSNNTDIDLWLNQRTKRTPQELARRKAVQDTFVKKTEDVETKPASDLNLWDPVPVNQETMRTPTELSRKRTMESSFKDYPYQSPHNGAGAEKFSIPNATVPERKPEKQSEAEKPSLEDFTQAYFKTYGMNQELPDFKDPDYGAKMDLIQQMRNDAESSYRQQWPGFMDRPLISEEAAKNNPVLEKLINNPILGQGKYDPFTGKYITTGITTNPLTKSPSEIINAPETQLATLATAPYGMAGKAGYEAMTAAQKAAYLADTGVNTVFGSGTLADTYAKRNQMTAAQLWANYLIGAGALAGGGAQAKAALPSTVKAVTGAVKEGMQELTPAIREFNAGQAGAVGKNVNNPVPEGFYRNPDGSISRIPDEATPSTNISDQATMPPKTQSTSGGAAVKPGAIPDEQLNVLNQRSAEARQTEAGLESDVARTRQQQMNDIEGRMSGNVPPKTPEVAVPQPEKPGFAGNIRLSKWDEAFHEDLKELTKDPEFVANSRRGTRSNKVTKEAAQGIIDKTGGDPDKIVKSLGEAYNAEEAYALDSLLGKADQDWKVIKEALEKNPLDPVLQVRNAEAQAKAAYLTAKAMGARAEMGRGLQQYKMLRQTLLSNDVKKMQQVLKKVGGDKINEFIEAAKGIDWNNPTQVNSLARQFLKPNWWDYPLEIFINSILSGPRTHIVNVGSTALYSAKEPFDTFVAALIDMPLSRMQGRKQAFFMGEALAELKVAGQGFKDGFRSFLKTVKTGIPAAEDIDRLEVRPNAFTGKTGRVINAPTNLLSAEDQALYSVNYAMAKAKLAYRKTMQMGLRGKNADTAFKDIYTDPLGDIGKQADALAKERLFRREAGKTTQSLMSLRDSFVPLKFLLPFIRTPINLAKVGLETSPLGLLNPKLMKNLATKNPEAAAQLAKAISGSVIAGGLYLYAKDGLITGAAPINVNERDRFYREGKQPYSLKIGSKWVSYQRIEPFNQLFTQVSALVDSVNNKDDQTFTEQAGQITMTILKNFVSQTYMSSLSDIVDAFSEPERYAEDVLAKLSTGMVPFSAAIRTAAQGIDTTYRKPEGIPENIKASIPGLSQQVPAKLNAFGEEVQRTTPWFSPVNISPEQESQLISELSKHSLNIGFVGNSIENVKLTREEQQEYQIQSGQYVKAKLTELVSTPEYQKLSTAEQRKLLEKTSDTAKADAREQYIINSGLSQPHEGDTADDERIRQNMEAVAESNNKFSQVPGMKEMGITLGEVGDSVYNLKLLPAEKNDYQRITGDYVSAQMNRMMSQPIVLTDNEKLKYLVDDYRLLTAAQQKSLLESRLSTIKSQARDAYIINSDVSTPKAGDTPDIGQQRMDLGLVKSWMEATEGVTNSTEKSIITNALRSLNLDLDAALTATGISTDIWNKDGVVKLLKARQGGNYSTSVQAVNVQLAQTIRKVIEPYYTLEDKVWSILPPDMREIDRQARELEARNDNAGAMRLYLKSPVARLMRLKIAQQKNQMKNRNPILSNIISRFNS